MTRICVIQGHPNGGNSHFCHALADAYVEGALSAGHEVRTIVVADLDFPILRSSGTGTSVKHRLPLFLRKTRSAGHDIC